MKGKKLLHRVLTAALTLIAVLSLSIPMYSHDMVTYAEWGTPVIDGVKEAVWDSAQSITVNQEAWEPMGEDATTAEVWSLWDGDYLYVYASAKDNLVDAELKDVPHENDCIGFMIDYSYTRIAEKNYRDLGEDAYAGYVNVPAVEGDKNYPNGGTVMEIPRYADDIQSYCKITDAGYDIEIRLPLKEYKNFVAGDKIGYEIYINSSRGNGKREGVSNWAFENGARGDESWQYTFNMGTLILNSKLIADEPAAEAVDAVVTDTAAEAAPVVTDAPQTNDVIATVVIAMIASAIMFTVSVSRKKISSK